MCKGSEARWNTEGFCSGSTVERDVEGLSPEAEGVDGKGAAVSTHWTRRSWNVRSLVMNSDWRCCGWESCVDCVVQETW